MAAKKTSENEVKNIVANLNLETISFNIEGIAPLIVSRFDEKSKQQIEEIGKVEQGLKQGGKKKNIADPKEQYEKSIYYFEDGKTYGFPAVAFKAAMVTAAYRTYGRPMTVTRSAFHVIADGYSAQGAALVKINGKPRMREDMVRVGTMTKVASPRYRAEFPVWGATLTIQYLANVISAEEIIGLANAAGFTCGVGEWRPEKSNSGSFGLFRVVDSK